MRFPLPLESQLSPFDYHQVRDKFGFKTPLFALTHFESQTMGSLSGMRGLEENGISTGSAKGYKSTPHVRSWGFLSFLHGVISC